MKDKSKTNEQTNNDRRIKTAATYNSLCFTSQVRMLSDNCSKWAIGRAYIPCLTVTIVKWCQNV